MLHRSPFLLAGIDYQHHKIITGLKKLTDIIGSSSSDASKKNNPTKTVNNLCPAHDTWRVKHSNPKITVIDIIRHIETTMIPIKIKFCPLYIFQINIWKPCKRGFFPFCGVDIWWDDLLILKVPTNVSSWESLFTYL